MAGYVYGIKEEVHLLRHPTDRLLVVSLVSRPFRFVSQSEHTDSTKLVNTRTIEHHNAYLSNGSTGRSLLSIALALNL